MKRSFGTFLAALVLFAACTPVFNPDTNETISRKSIAGELYFTVQAGVYPPARALRVQPYATATTGFREYQYIRLTTTGHYADGKTSDGFNIDLAADGTIPGLEIRPVAPKASALTGDEEWNHDLSPLEYKGIVVNSNTVDLRLPLHEAAIEYNRLYLRLDAAAVRFGGRPALNSDRDGVFAARGIPDEDAQDDYINYFDLENYNGYDASEMKAAGVRPDLKDITTALGRNREPAIRPDGSPNTLAAFTESLTNINTLNVDTAIFVEGGTTIKFTGFAAINGKQDTFNDELGYAFHFQKFDYGEKKWLDLSPAPTARYDSAKGELVFTLASGQVSRLYDFYRYSYNPYLIKEKAPVLGTIHRLTYKKSNNGFGLLSNDTLTPEGEDGYKYVGGQVNHNPTLASPAAPILFPAPASYSAVFGGSRNAYHITVKIDDTHYPVSGSFRIDEAALKNPRNIRVVRYYKNTAAGPEVYHNATLNPGDMDIINPREFRVHLPGNFIKDLGAGGRLAVLLNGIEISYKVRNSAGTGFDLIEGV
ncbi:MAG: hypothetical protein LBQ38_04580, partial [Spirochaetaceae bacterium]|nr:hypothetical protein [Spirochaetaceae bacterium]